jgi:hypothetical protein
MWRQVSFATPLLPQSDNATTKVGDGDIEVHSHSPRRRTISVARQTLRPSTMGSMLPPGLPMYSRVVSYDPFTEPGSSRHWRHPSSSVDVSMPDYSTSTSNASGSRQVTDPMVITKQERRFQSMQTVGAYETICDALRSSEPVATMEEDIDKALSEKEGSKMELQLKSTSGMHSLSVIPTHLSLSGTSGGEY